MAYTAAYDKDDIGAIVVDLLATALATVTENIGLIVLLAIMAGIVGLVGVLLAKTFGIVHF